MSWKWLHRWLGLVLGTLALVLGITGAALSLDPLRNAWLTPPAVQDQSVATLAERVQAQVPGLEEIRRLPSGLLVAFAFDGDQPQAWRIDPATGRPLGAYQPSALPRWLKNLHRSWLAGDAGRLTSAAVALAMLGLSVTGLVLLLRRMGGWRHLAGTVRGTLAQRLHVLTGRVLLPVLALSAVTALWLSAATFGLVSLDAKVEPEVVSQANGQARQADLPPGRLPLLQQLRVQDLRKLNLPAPDDPQDSWQVTTSAGQGWVDRSSGQTLAWQDATAAQRVQDWALLLHTGDGAWAWAVVLGVMGLSIVLFWATGLWLWWQARQLAPRISDNSPLQQADALIFVASEGGSSWAFTQALHAALVQAGRRVHTTGLEHFCAPPGARQLFVLAATYGEGQAPAHAAGALARIAQTPATAAPVAVLGFGDRQFPAYCAFAEAVAQALQARGWQALLPLERIHQQSAQEFARWGDALAQTLGQPLAIDYRPRLPALSELPLLVRQDFEGGAGDPAVILRLGLPKEGRRLPRFVAGDLLAIVAPGSSVPRYYSLASGTTDGFAEICVRRRAGGLCSSLLHGLQPGASVPAFIRANPGFALAGGKAPLLLIGAGTGVAPLAGFIRGNASRRPMHLFYGTRTPERDFFFGQELQGWQADGRLQSLHTAFSRTPDGGGHVQDALQRNAAQVGALLARGAHVRVCGSRPMAHGVSQVLQALLAPLGLSLAQLKERGRYAEDLF
ncbi:MAG: PepSY domain-containing protein [Proteobacteria bacterium]|nr:PepSY domain-containing protein [Pseudomonadota bacterium]MBS0495012.1 PepSY domain-containing protein [Pseudomonadota bacterium]